MSILLIRHGSAGNRFTWGGDDTDRPLDPLGVAQAASLAEDFVALPVSVVLSSQAVRCQQTVLPLARRAGLRVTVDEALFEGMSSQALQLVERLAKDDDRNGAAVLCSHGDVISEILRSLILIGIRTSGDRGSAKSSVWELSCRGGIIVEGRYHHPSSVEIPFSTGD